jgi:Domain of unknown function (DUF2760).
MTEKKLSLFSRFTLALSVLGRTLVDAEFADGVRQLRMGKLPAEPGTPKPSLLKESPPDAALQLLGLLQQEGRFVDFMQEDVSVYTDAQVGAAARMVHDGCRKILNEHLTLAPIRDEPENSRVTLESGFDASAVRLTGNVIGQPPFTGTLVHRGWRATEVKLPKLSEAHDTGILAPAEVEL